MRIIFAGTPIFAATILQSLIDGPHEVIGVYTQPDRPAGRGQHLHASEVKQLALAHHIPVYQPETFRNPQVQAQLAVLKPDMMVVAVYSSLLPQAVLDIPRLGCLNIHPSLLPRWRGAAPIARPIAAGEMITGVSMMQMVAALDAGPLWEVFTLPIDPSDTHASLSARLATLCAQHMNATLHKIEYGTLTPIPQDHSQSCYAAKLSKAEGLINWNESAESIARKVRAYNPWPVAYTYLQGQMLRVWQAQAVENIATSAPGKIIALSNEGMDVNTGAGVLRLQKVQLAGKCPIHAGELIKTQHPLFRVGNILC